MQEGKIISRAPFFAGKRLTPPILKEEKRGGGGELRLDNNYMYNKSTKKRDSRAFLLKAEIAALLFPFFDSYGQHPISHT